MGQERFWRLIGRLGRRGDVERLVVALGRLSGGEILGFQQRLREAVAALDTPAHRGQPVADVSGRVPGYLSEDAFEDLRLAVVAAGRTRWAAAVADPSTVAGVWRLGLGEELGRAAEQAYELATGDPWPNLTAASAPDTGLPPAARHGWLMIVPAWGELAPPAAYQVHIDWLERKLNQPSWQEWWDAARGDQSQLVCFYEFEATGRRRSSVRVGPDPSGRVEVSVTIRLPPVQTERPDLDPAGDEEGWAALARAHVGLLFDTLLAKFGIDHPPALPPAAKLERERRAAAEQDAAYTEAFLAWNLERTTAVPTLWAGRAPDHAIGELIAVLQNGGRVRLPRMIAEMRSRYAIPATSEDARLLAQHGYSAEEIATALA